MRLRHGHDADAAAQIDLLDHAVGLARTRSGPDLGAYPLALLFVDVLSDAKFVRKSQAFYDAAPQYPDPGSGLGQVCIGL
jgi:hypothetical protein